MSSGDSFPAVTRRVVLVKAYLSASSSSSDEGSDIDLTFGMQVLERPRRLSDMPADYFAIVKATKFLSLGRQNACVAALSSMQEYDLLHPLNLTALCEEESLEKLVNMCEVNHLRCRAGALLLLRKITKNRFVATATVNLGLVPVCVDRLKENSLDIMESAASILSNVGHLRRASKALRRVGGIPVLISHLNVSRDILVAPEDSLQPVERGLVNVCRCAADALWVVSRFSKNKSAMLKTGILPLVSMVLLSGNSKVSTPISGILSECSSLLLFQLAIETEGLVGVLIENMASKNERLAWSSAWALMRAASGCESVRHMVRFHGGLEVLVRLLRDASASAPGGGGQGRGGPDGQHRRGHERGRGHGHGHGPCRAAGRLLDDGAGPGERGRRRGAGRQRAAHSVHRRRGPDGEDARRGRAGRDGQVRGGAAHPGQDGRRAAHRRHAHRLQRRAARQRRAVPGPHSAAPGGAGGHRGVRRRAPAVVAAAPERAPRAGGGAVGAQDGRGPRRQLGRGPPRAHGRARAAHAPAQGQRHRAAHRRRRRRRRGGAGLQQPERDDGAGRGAAPGEHRARPRRRRAAPRAVRRHRQLLLRARQPAALRALAHHPGGERLPGVQGALAAGAGLPLPLHAVARPHQLRRHARLRQRALPAAGRHLHLPGDPNQRGGLSGQHSAHAAQRGLQTHAKPLQGQPGQRGHHLSSDRRRGGTEREDNAVAVHITSKPFLSTCIYFL